MGSDTSWNSVGGLRPLSEQYHGGVQDPRSLVLRDHLGAGSGPFLGAFALEALGKSRCAGTGDSGFGSAGGISQRQLECQGVGFWQRSMLKGGGRGGGGRRGHQSHPREVPSCSGRPLSAAIGSVTTQKSLLGVLRRAGSVHLTARLLGGKSETNLSIPCGCPAWSPGTSRRQKTPAARSPRARGAW